VTRSALATLVVLAVSPACDSPTPKRKRTEAAHYLDQMIRAAKVSFHMSDGRFLVGKAGPTPAGPCCGQPTNKCPQTGAWKTDPVWSKLEIAIPEPTLYQYSYESDGTTFRFTATGDLDCDGVFGTWTADGAISQGAPTATVTRPPNGTY
jgi:hypothetical protein